MDGCKRYIVSDSIRFLSAELMTAASVDEVIRRPGRAKGWVFLPIRWTVERTFAWRGHCRRLWKDGEKTALSSAPFIVFAMTWFMLHHLRSSGVDPAFRHRDAA
ncbi:transposase [Paludisphaera soli]|uniref:transposase n=1 Tax=Paludisphaera soli TaxID=2712865 RepID=UPI0013EB2364|nr:transposase [Paludisphaera soli]